MPSDSPSPLSREERDELATGPDFEGEFWTGTRYLYAVDVVLCYEATCRSLEARIAELEREPVRWRVERPMDQPKILEMRFRIFDRDLIEFGPDCLDPALRKVRDEFTRVYREMTRDPQAEVAKVFAESLANAARRAPSDTPTPT